MGPTASGKTDLAVDLAERLDGEIISVDSALIYRGMDIGTAKPEAELLKRVPHHLLDILDPAESYSAADFRRDALSLIESIIAKGKTPILAGGTMLYFKVLLEGLSPLPAADEKIRQEIEKQAQQSGWQQIHGQLREVDPVSAERIHPNDPQRLTRALEVYRLSGKSLTELTEVKHPPLPHDVVQFAVTPAERSELHQRIEVRFKQMMERGFEDEVRQLYERGDLTPDLPSIRCVGYRQIWNYLDGEYDRDEAIFRGIVATRQLAKRQVTWLRSWPALLRLDSNAKDNIDIMLSMLCQSGSAWLY